MVVMLSDPPPDAATQLDAISLMRFPLSSSQERCWFINALDPGTTALNVALRWELRGKFDASLIERAFGYVIERQEALRTRIVEEDGVAMQEVCPPFRPKLVEVDLSGLPEQQRSAEVLRIGREEAHKPFDLTELPLIRITLVRVAPDRAQLLLTVHQIAFDGWSIRLISAEFGMAAAALSAGMVPDLPELQLHYGDYASWQAAFFESCQFDREVEYWKRRLAGAPYFEVPGDRPRQARPTANGEILAIIVPDALSEAMERKAKVEGVTTFGFGCAVIATALHAYTGATDIIVGTQIAGRNEPDLETLIGVFINNLVLRFDLSGDPTFRDLLGRANQTVRDALIHQAMPFHRLVEILKPPRDPSRLPLISVNFTVLQDVMENARYETLEIIGHPSLSAGSLYDLNFFLVRWPTGWRMALEYNTDLFDKRTGETLLELWRDTLARAVEDEDFPLSALLADGIAGSRGAALATAADAQDRDGDERPRTVPTAASEAERTVMTIWQELLDLPAISLDTDFFESGGHSILALRMLARIGKAFGRKVEVATLFAAPTARAFAQALETRKDATQAKSWNIVPIQPKGTKTPIIVINNMVIYHEVAMKLGPDRPVIGIQLFDPEEGQVPADDTFEAICERYVTLVRSARPHGPYVLMGLCVAGIIAYEVARRLRDAGEQVPLVIMADSWRPGFLAQLPRFRSLLFWQSYRWHMAAHHLKTIRSGRATVLSVLHTYPKIRRSAVFKSLQKAMGSATDDLGKEDWTNRWFLPYLERLRDLYVARPTPGKVALLQSEETNIPFLDPGMGWSPLTEGRLLRHRVEGWHADMFKGPGARAIVDFLQPLLAEVDEADGATGSIEEWPSARRRQG